MREALEQMQADMRERWADPFYLLWYGTKSKARFCLTMFCSTLGTMT